MKQSLLFILIIFISCQKETINPPVKNGTKTGTIIKNLFPKRDTLQILTDSREVILTQTEEWENRLLGYFNVVKKGEEYKLWYMAWSFKSNSEFSTSFCFASSSNGIDFIKPKPTNQLNEFGIPNGVLENYVFYDQYIDKYKLIGVDNDAEGKARTFMWTSDDGIKWYGKTKILDLHHDSQFSVIVNESNYEIYMRVWSNSKRSIGYCKIDKNYKLLEQPKVFINESGSPSYPHIYNSSVSSYSRGKIFFPTIYNSNIDEMSITYGFIDDRNSGQLLKKDITEHLYEGEDILWGIVSPNIIPTGVKDEYWLYYYGSTRSHFKRLIEKGITKFYRIKIRIVSI